jgi:hypothetical protein
MRRLLALWLLVILALGCAPASAAGCGSAADGQACTRILFIGNSYTYVNDLPTMVGELARSGGHRVETAMAAEGGFTFVDHVASSATQTKLGSTKWDLVVLQEQSEIPSVDRFRSDQMYPAARQLVHTVRFAGAKPLFFLTWAHRDGWPENGLRDYRTMQAAIVDGYQGIANEIFVPIAPVGVAWAAVVAADPRPGLWQDDGTHPTAKGTYLAACVFYAAIFHASPVGVAFTAGLSKETAESLQQVAADTVLTDPAKWGLQQ